MPTLTQSSQKRRRVMLAMYWWEERVFDGVAKYAVENNWILDSRMRWTHTDEYLRNWEGDGIIANPGFSKPLKNLLTLIKESNIPTVSLQSFGEDHSKARVLIDHVKVGQEAARHLISREFRNLAYIKSANNELENERAKGFRSVAQQAGFQYFEIPFASLRKRLKELPLPIGIMASNDFNAFDAMTVCTESGFSIPDEVAILGADDSRAFCEHTEIPISSVKCKFEDQGYLAASILDRLMSGEAPPEVDITVSTDGVTDRRSTDTIAVDDALSRKTLSIIRERYKERLKVKDIAELVGVSPRSLQLSFKKNLGFTMSDELTRLRLEHSKVLLSTTDQKLDSVAYECGFSGRHHLISSFTREFEVTPSEFRSAQLPRKN